MIERIFFLNQLDCAEIHSLGKHFYSLTGLSGEFKIDTFRDFWNGFLEKGMAAMWVYRNREIIVGTIGMTISMCLMDGKVLVDEQFWFVDPHHRGTAGIRLFAEMKRWAIDSGAQRLLMGKMLSIGGENDKVGKFYERCGMRPLQTQYFLDL